MTATIIIFTIITLCLISGQVLCFKVTGCTGESVMFKCTYKPNDQHKGKYFCRDRDCRTGISTETQRSWVYKGRFSLYDDEDSRFFTVFIRNLSREDDGEYTCGNNQTWSHDVKLVVNRTSSSCGTSVLQTAYKGQTVTFHCEYNHMFQTHTKLLYRVNRDPVLVLNSSQTSQSSEEKFNLSDSHKDHFNVTIRNISAADDGVYLCGVEIYGSSKKRTYIAFIKEIHLNVSGQLTSSKPPLTSSKPPVVKREGDSVQIKCSYDENYSAEVKHLCKGKCLTPDDLKNYQSDEDHDKNTKISVKNDTELSLFTVNMTDLRAEDAGKYWCLVKDTFNVSIELMIVMKKVVTREASVGGSVSISCKYFRNQTLRFFCRGDQPNICFIDGVRVSSNNRINSRFSLTEETSAGVFTVNISDLRAEDSGKYWCAEESSGSFIFTEVQLHVTTGFFCQKHEVSQ
ncbi:polymeric immunoglobulin receptor-like [Carassius auratus]|uniref:polymeric immunoglobulin receptor-like n=1 Tax=Carassius auratus TaxID=7957 RepID=UPI000E417DDA|nr:polymeric immunoglobulin receptor-like [Carassius auratus]XP_026138127.1 polymeric immunoglobulin receptor-like [Carassius auratus]